MTTSQNEYNQAMQNLITMIGKKIEIKKVWTNASPTSNFGNQTLTLNLSDYDFVLVLLELDKNGRTTLPSIVKVGDNAINECSGNTRYFKTSKTAIKFDSTSSAATMIPLLIYGMKGVI